MNYQLRFEGFGLDEELREKLMQCVRDFVLRIGPDHLLEVAVKQVDGLVQSRVEIALASRTLSALVRRKDPVAATEAAIQALAEVLKDESAFNAPVPV